MPSPFPGMDPYLEGELWPGIHHELAVTAKHQLTPLLQPHYYPFTERYFLPEDDEGMLVDEKIMPDVGVARERPGRAHSTTAKLQARAPVIMELLEPLAIAHYRIAIRDVERRKLITAIEFLSPTNKRGTGRQKYLRKRETLLKSTAHLVEIDLLRRGQRLPVKGKLPAGSYFAYVSRAQERPKVRVWPLGLEEALPTLPVPLGKKNEEVPLDLQKALTEVYDRGSYATLINYRRPPDVPFDKNESAWAVEFLRGR